MKKRKKREAKGANWMDTYGDMVTLLLTFFVLLYSFSSIDSNKWERLAAALSGGKGVLLEQNAVEKLKDGEKPGEKSNNVLADGQISVQNAENLYRQLKEYIEQNKLEKDVALTRADDEIRIRFTSSVLFDLGKADIRPDAHQILNDVAYAIKTYDKTIEMVRIEGHTDTLPIKTKQFPSNWELSTARAVNVLRYLIENSGLPAEMLSAVGYGEYHPIGDNSMEEGRKLNRRVDFVINVIN